MTPTPAPPAAPGEVEFTVARAAGVTALYRRPRGAEQWDLIFTEPGEATTVLVALEASGAPVRVMEEALHLLVEGAFPDRLATFASPTAVSMLRAEAALLRKQAADKRYDAGMSGEWGDRGAAGLEKIADAYDHAIEIFETYPS